ncbi:E3 ubiquitin-protein ligase TRIM33-like [Haliotis rubra]|uniref:E3 ubiquitin-protein ligase TRIM33-like n=1 Tax=Haliotis rubra TaxID=36100 RepID=UPI001EE62626|nr:E3 ubiquitin-protein ligase TRIM33-like [Haliotis rubra]
MAEARKLGKNLRLLPPSDGRKSKKTTSLKPPATTVEETACVLQTSPDCDTGQLLLLPCLHAACKPCIDQHNQNDIVCSCGRDINLEKERTAVDFVRRNEIALATDEHECEFLTGQCTEKVVSHCKTCNISMCANCTDKHNTTRATSKHAVVLAEQFNEMPIRERLPLSTCSNHPTKIVNFFDEQCHTSVCSVCAIGKHKDHGIKDLDETFQKTKVLLLNKLDQHKEHLQKIQTSSRQVQSRMTELEERGHQLTKEIADVHTDLALHLVKRLKVHSQQIEKEVEKHKRNLQKDMECLGTTESAVLATLSYADRSLTSTTCAQFMDLSSTIVSKIDQDFLNPFPEDSVKTKALTFTPKGHKALREIVGMFGRVSTSDKDVDDADTVPTITDLQSQLAIFKDQEKVNN